jgi:phosphatidylserine decarboxylase
MRFQTLYEGRWIFGVLIALAALGWWLAWPWLVAIAILLILFCINFFRDPDRHVPVEAGAIVAAADGTITDIVEVDETEVLKTRCKRVGIFLSVIDVHVNRAPTDGKIVFVKHYPGLFLDARRPECSLKNEAMVWAFQGDTTTLVVRQITGAIARRIVGWAKLGDTVKKGERFGMIRFGSRTEVYLPLHSEITINVGDKVLGGATIIARLTEPR